MREEHRCGVMGLFVGIFVGLIVGFLFGVVTGEDDARRMAVKAGVAEWKADPHGRAEFHFIDTQKK